MSAAKAPVLFSNSRERHPNEAFNAGRHVPLDSLPDTLTIGQLRHALAEKYPPAVPHLRNEVGALVNSINGRNVASVLGETTGPSPCNVGMRPACILLLRELVEAIFPESSPQ